MVKSKKRIWIRLILLLIFAALIGGGIYYLLTHYKIKNVYVEGNLHYTVEEIKAMIMDQKLGDNSLYLSLKYKNKGIENIPFIDVMNVTVLAPDTIKITVFEKALAGYVKCMDSYMYFDKDGYVIENSSVKTLGVAQITGLSFDYAVLGEPLPVEDKEVFDDILTITKLLDKYELGADKIYFHGQREVTIYFGEIKVTLGNDKTHLEDKIMLLPTFLPELTGRSGTLQMESYDPGKGKYTFKPD